MAYIYGTTVDASRRFGQLNNDQCLAFHRIKLATGTMLTLSDTIVMFDQDQIRGYQVVDYLVGMDQVDTNASPAVAWNIGHAAFSSGGISSTLGERWATGVTTLGRTAQTSLYRAQNGDHYKKTGRAKPIGLCPSVLPGTPAWDGKEIFMALLLAPYLP